MVGDHDAAGAGLQGLQRAVDGHDTLEDEGLTGHSGDLLQLLHRLAAGGRGQVFQEGQTGGVNVHGDGEGIGSLHQFHLLPDGVHVPGLHGGHAAAAVLFQGLGSGLHDGGVGAVAGEGGDTGLGAGGHQDVVVGQVVVLVAVVELHGAHGSGEHGQGHLVAEQLKGGIHGLVLADGVHVYAQLLPLLVVADEAGADALGAGAGDGVLAGQAVAGGAGLAVGAHAGPGVCQDLLICHMSFLRCKSFSFFK